MLSISDMVPINRSLGYLNCIYSRPIKHIIKETEQKAQYEYACSCLQEIVK